MILGRQYDEKVDVYSAGVVGWSYLLPESRIFNPYKGMHPSGLLVSVAVEGLRPLVPADCNPDIAEILGLCWLGPDRRPSAAEFANGLERVNEENSDEKGECLKQRRVGCCTSRVPRRGAISNAAYKRINTIKSESSIGEGVQNHILSG